MQDLVSFLTENACQLISDAAEKLSLSKQPESNQFRFRCDGKGGILATPFPMIAGTDPDALASTAAEEHPLFDRIYASDRWLALDPSPVWYAEVEHAEWTDLIVPKAVIPAVPAFPAHIDPLTWALDSQLGFADPLIAARLDQSNPARTILRAAKVSENGPAEGIDPSLLLRKLALLSHFQDDLHRFTEQFRIVADCYLAAPVLSPLIHTVFKHILTFYPN